MKWIARIFTGLGFTFQYLIPLLLFGNVVPYTHGELAAGLTKMGYFAIAVFALIMGRKLKEWLLTKPKSMTRGVLLSAFPICFWLIASIGVNWLAVSVQSIAEYWDKLIIFIVIGRVFYIGNELLSTSEGEKKDESR